jgi:glyoxylase-like metal-dependent hydrolase (beta-lactamase superfamily II)
MDPVITNYLESNNYNLIGVLLTHNHVRHINGIRAIKRIYTVDIYSANNSVMDYNTIMVKDGQELDLSLFHVTVISTPGHSVDSVVYKIDNMLFTGDVLSAGLVGKTDSSYGAMRQIAMIQNKIFSLRGNLLVFPGHGPPSSLEIERSYNYGIGRFEEKRSKTKKTSLGLNLLS